jgi:hypothetical protein
VQFELEALMPVTQEYEKDLDSNQMFISSNQCIPDKGTLCVNAVVSCYGELIPP